MKKLYDCLFVHLIIRFTELDNVKSKHGKSILSWKQKCQRPKRMNKKMQKVVSDLTKI